MFKFDEYFLVWNILSRQTHVICLIWLGNGNVVQLQRCEGYH